MLSETEKNVQKNKNLKLKKRVFGDTYAVFPKFAANYSSLVSQKRG